MKAKRRCEVGNPEVQAGGEQSGGEDQGNRPSLVHAVANTNRTANSNRRSAVDFIFDQTRRVHEKMEADEKRGARLTEGSRTRGGECRGKEKGDHKKKKKKQSRLLRTPSQ